jgi:hypothetical protein
VTKSTEKASEFVGQALASVSVRPRRIGYLVQTGNARQVRKAIAYASSEWGGAGHPIVPVQRRDRIGPGLWQLLEVLRPEVLIDYVGATERLRTELASRLGCQVMDEPRAGSDEPGVHVLVALPARSLLARTLFVAPTRADLMTEAAVGIMQTDRELQELWIETGATQASIGSTLDLLDAQVDVPSPIWATRQQFVTTSTQLVGSPVIVYATDRPNVAGILYFWNTRALAAESRGSWVIWVPQSKATDPGVGARLRGLCATNMQMAPDLVINGMPTTDFDSIAQGWGFTEHRSTTSTLTFTMGRRGLRSDPPTYWKGVDPRTFLLRERTVGLQARVPLTVTSPSFKLHVTSPLATNPAIGGHIRLDITSVEALEWPRRPETAHLVHDDAIWADGSLSLVVRPSTVFDLPLRVPDAQAVISATLASAGWTWSPSDKGQYASALLGAVAGRRAIPSLADRTCLRVIKALGSLTSRKAVQVLRASLPATVTQPDLERAVAAALPALVPQWLTSSEIAGAITRGGARSTKREVIAALTRLLADQLVTRAFRFDCQNCLLRSHIPIGRSAERVRCDGCTTEAALTGSSGEPDLAYGLNTLLDRAADQDCHGHLPVQDWIQTNLGAVFSVPGADLHTVGGIRREIDVLAISRTELILAEVKTAVGGFTVDALNGAADLALATKADHLVLAALGEWPTAERTAAAGIADRSGVKLTLLGLEELAP